MSRYFKPLAVIACFVILFSTVVVSAVRPPIALAAATVATCAPDSGSATITGTVKGIGGAPLSGVIVTAYTTYGDRGGYGYTNAAGIYQITGLISGSYILEVAPQSGGYAATWSGNAANAQTATPIAVVEGGTVSGANAQLELGARFSGTVRGAGGGLLNSVNVSVYDGAGKTVARAYTNAAGMYTTAPGLPTGSYRVGFAEPSGFLDSYANGKASLETADPIAVVAPDVRSGTDATLARGGQISGNVSDATTGMPLINIAVSASGVNGSGNGYTDASGNYTITGLATGSYTVRATPVFETDNLIGAPQTATVAAPGTVGVNFVLAAGGTLSGRVTDEGGTALKDVTVFLSNADGSYQNYVSTNFAGDYSAVALPTGEYRVLFRPSSYIPEAYNNHPDFADAEVVAVTAPNTVTGINAVLAKGGVIKGKVTDATSGLPVKDIFVEVLDASGGRVESTNTLADGTYQTYATLASGSYSVRFNADERFASCTYVTEYYNHKPTKTGADQVKVSAPNVVANIDAALTRGSILFGKVTNATTGAPITSGQVTIFDATGTVAMFGRLSFLGGWHTETGLPSGSYRVLFGDYDTGYIDEYYNNKPSLAAADPISVNAPIDLAGLDATLAAGATFSGRVTAADTGLPFTNGAVIVFNTQGEEVGYASIEDDGSYRVSNGLASDNYRVGVIPYSNTQGEEDLTRAARAVITGATLAPGYSPTFYRGTVALNSATPLTLTAPNTTTDIDIAMLRSVSLPLTQR